jgi:cytochrome c oxidase subunit III
VIDSRQLDLHPSRRALTIGMWLLLAALSMLFIAGMVLYSMFRFRIFGAVAPAPVELPPATWASTAILLLGSFTMHRAVVNVRIERLSQLRRWLYVSCALAVLFLMVQTPCMIELWRTHRAAAAAVNMNSSIAQPLPLDGLVFCLILLHALHVIGGIIAMSIVMTNVYGGRYDHESYMGIRHAALYWHFLDVVWLTMFAVFMATG